jgi:hypothetical protein
VQQRRGAAPVLVAGVGEEDFRQARLVRKQTIGRARLWIALADAGERKEIGRIEERRELMGVA